MEEETNITTSEIIQTDSSDTINKIANNINLMLSVLTFTIIIVFLYRYLKICLGKK